MTVWTSTSESTPSIIQSDLPPISTPAHNLEEALTHTQTVPPPVLLTLPFCSCPNSSSFPFPFTLAFPPLLSTITHPPSPHPSLYWCCDIDICTATAYHLSHSNSSISLIPTHNRYISSFTSTSEVGL